MQEQRERGKEIREGTFRRPASPRCTSSGSPSLTEMRTPNSITMPMLLVQSREMRARGYWKKKITRTAAYTPTGAPGSNYVRCTFLFQS